MKTLIAKAKDFASGMSERKLSIYATSGCYYFFMSLVPIVMIICCVLPYTRFNQATVLNYIDVYFSAELGKIMRQIVEAIYRSNSATMTVSILLTLYSASASMKALMRGMDAAYDIRKKDHFIRFSIRALLYMVLLVVALMLSLVVMVYGNRILFLIQSRLPDFARIGVVSFLLSKVRYVLVMVMLTLFFACLYTLMPTEKVRFRAQLPGAIFSAVVWVIFSSVFTVYVGVSDKYGAYGFIGTIMVAMMWIYYCLFFLLIGGYINSYFSK